MSNPDFEELLNFLVPFAQQQLAEHGGFIPFAAAVSKKGELQPTAAMDGNENPEAEEIIALLTEGFRQHAAAGKIRASGICLDILTIPPGEKKKTDAICVRLERAGEAVDAMLPYKKGVLGKYKFGEMFAVEGERSVFPA